MRYIGRCSGTAPSHVSVLAFACHMISSYANCALGSMFQSGRASESSDINGPCNQQSWHDDGGDGWLLKVVIHLYPFMLCTALNSERPNICCCRGVADRWEEKEVSSWLYVLYVDGIVRIVWARG